jgi:DNA polymerase-3 subunit gamma/tau
VRFLRNALVAKVAGPSSSLLQISADEQARVARIAALFGEEDLTRFLQIMLRTHGDVSYKQEQRFHLELGVLKLVHAQRLLPLEQLLSESNLSAGRSGTGAPPSRPPAAPRTPATASGISSGIVSGITSNDKPLRPSPFDLDRTRRSGGGKPEMSTSGTSGSIGSAGQHAAAVAVVARETPPDASPLSGPTADPERAVSSMPALGSPEYLEAVRGAMLAALEEAGQRMAADALEEGEWSVTASGVTVKVSGSEQLIAMTFGPEQHRLMQQAAETSAGRPLRISITPGAAKKAAVTAAPRSSAPGSARAKAAQHPVVRRMMEKFGAELRTVLDNDQ